MTTRTKKWKNQKLIVFVSAILYCFFVSCGSHSENESSSLPLVDSSIPVGVLQ